MKLNKTMSRVIYTAFVIPAFVVGFSVSNSAVKSYTNSDVGAKGADQEVLAEFDALWTDEAVIFLASMSYEEKNPLTGDMLPPIPSVTSDMLPHLPLHP